MLAVGVVCPSFASEPVRPEAMSEKLLFTFALSIVVPETNAASARLKVPDPSLATGGLHWVE
jgi:hypothetical protein